MIVKTASGKEFESGYFVKSEEYDYLDFDVKDVNPKTVNDVFCDPEETNRIECSGQVYEGYTRFGTIQVFYDSVRVKLRRHG